MNKIMEFIRKKYRAVLMEESSAKTERIYFRVSEEEKEIVMILAKLKHKSQSQFVRDLIFVDYLNKFVK